MNEPITFLASFPPIQSAIKRSGDAGGMRIQLDIPESEMANAALLLAMVQQRLRITVEIVPNVLNRKDQENGKTANSVEAGAEW